MKLFMKGHLKSEDYESVYDKVRAKFLPYLKSEYRWTVTVDPHPRYGGKVWHYRIWLEE